MPVKDIYEAYLTAHPRDLLQGTGYPYCRMKYGVPGYWYRSRGERISVFIPFTGEIAAEFSLYKDPDSILTTMFNYSGHIMDDSHVCPIWWTPEDVKYWESIVDKIYTGITPMPKFPGSIRGGQGWIE